MVVQVLEAPPAVGAPTPPRPTAAPTRSAAARLLKPTADQETGAAAVASELGGTTTYVADFSDKAPPQDSITSQFALAAAWSAEETRAATWWRYAMNMKELTFHAALSAGNALRPEFDRAEKYDPSIATRYRETAGFLDARKVAAARALATKRAKKKAAKKS